jgi:tetratricopeptide (TPR) repeat protein
MMVYWPDFNDFWDYNNPEETEKVFRRILATAPTSGDSPSEGNGSTKDTGYYLQLKTQIGRTLGLQGRFEEAHEILNEVEAAMAAGDIVEVRYLLERGRALNSSKRASESIPLFLRSFEIAKEISADYYAVDALHMLGIAAETAEERMEWNLKAIDYAKGSDQERANNWLASLYNNTAWGLFDEERYEEALDLFQQAQEFREKLGDPHTLNIARWCVAKTLRVMGRVEEALAIQRQLEADAEQDGFTEEEIGECLLALGKKEEAGVYFKLAYELLSEIDWVMADTARMERIKSLAAL